MAGMADCDVFQAACDSWGGSVRGGGGGQWGGHTLQALAEGGESVSQAQLRRGGLTGSCS